MQVESPTKQIIMIDIDVLFDTRLGTLAFLYPDKVESLLAKGFRGRLHDNFDLLDSSIDMNQYNTIYNNRDKSVIAISRITNFMCPLLEIVKEYEWEMTYETEGCNDVDLVVNTFPYELEDAEVHQLMVGLREQLGFMIDIKFTRRDPKTFNIASLCYQGFTQYVMYHFNDWVAHHYSDEEKIKGARGRPDFIIIAPKLYSDYRKLSGDDELKSVLASLSGGNGEEAGFELTTIAFAPHFNLVYMDTTMMSLIDLNRGPSPDKSGSGA